MGNSQNQKFQNQRQMTNRQSVSRTESSSENIHLSEIPNIEEKKASFPDKPSYLKYSFVNPYNLAMFGGALAASVMTLNPFIAVAALGLEGLWLLHGSQSRFMQRLLWDPIYEKEKIEFDENHRMDRVQSLSQYGRKRVLDLIGKEKQIQSLAAQNPSFTGTLLRDQLTKTSILVNAFIDLGLTCARYENYLNTVDLKELTADLERWKAFVDSNQEDSTDIEFQIARKNLSVIGKRLERVQEIRRYLNVAFGQLDLIENSFKLIADQIVTMQSPNELSGQLDELLDGVESIKETSIETEKILRTL